MDAPRFESYTSLAAAAAALTAEAAALATRAAGPAGRHRAVERAVLIATEAARDLDQCPGRDDAYRLCVSSLCAASIALAEAKNALADVPRLPVLAPEPVAGAPWAP